MCRYRKHHTNECNTGEQTKKSGKIAAAKAIKAVSTIIIFGVPLTQLPDMDKEIADHVIVHELFRIISS